MKAVVFHNIGDIRLDDIGEPKIEQTTDAIVRLTASAICGTDLHMVRGTMAGMKAGTILGHEGVGVRGTGKRREKSKCWRSGSDPFNDRLGLLFLLSRRLLLSV